MWTASGDLLCNKARQQQSADKKKEAFTSHKKKQVAADKAKEAFTSEKNKSKYSALSDSDEVGDQYVSAFTQGKKQQSMTGSVKGSPSGANVTGGKGTEAFASF